MDAATPGLGPDAGWRAAPDLVWTRYEDAEDWVVYNPASSDIHLLTDSAYRLWTLVGAEGGGSSQALAALLATALARPLDDELLTVTRDALTSLDQAGLVSPVWP